MPQLTLAAQLDRAVREVAPHISGVSIGRRADRATWRVVFADDAEAEEIDRANAIVATFEPVDEEFEAPAETSAAPAPARTINLEGATYAIAPADAVKFSAALWKVLSRQPAEISLTSGQVLTLTPENIDAVMAQLA